MRNFLVANIGICLKRNDVIKGPVWSRDGLAYVSKLPAQRIFIALLYISILKTDVDCQDSAFLS